MDDLKDMQINFNIANKESYGTFTFNLIGTPYFLIYMNHELCLVDTEKGIPIKRIPQWEQLKYNEFKKIGKSLLADCIDRFGGSEVI